MNKLKNLFVVVAVTVASSSYAVEFPWLTFRLTDDTEMSVAAENLALNYSEGNLVLRSATVDHTIPVSEIKTMQFTSFSAGVEGVYDFQSGEADYYTLSGNLAGHFKTIDEARKILPSGVYIRKGSGNVCKIIF